MKKKMMILLALLAAVVLLSIAAFAVSGGSEDEIRVEEIVAEQTEVLPEMQAQEDMEHEESMAEEDEFDIAELYGAVTEATDAYVMLDTQLFGQVQANLTDDTIIEGVESIEIGQVVKVIYDGKMTRSIPAQITAMLVGVYAVEGEVTEIADGRITVKRADTGEEVIISLPEDAQEIAVGDIITAYTNGAMTMSLPPQMNAVAIVK